VQQWQSGGHQWIEITVDAPSERNTIAIYSDDVGALLDSLRRCLTEEDAV
jgi:hypothetical protein